VCSGIGLGSIITTYYRNGVAEKIPNVDTVTNPACTNPGDGSPTSGAGGFWVKDGELSTGGTPSDTAQGNCMTCHDVHWALADTNPEAEAFRRECTTCHSHAGASASGAPRIDLANIAHVTGPGTPLENWLTEPDEACETCHMPKSSGTGSRMHLWRINPDPTYKTMGTTQANLAPVPDGTYDNAAWVDIDHACGQCHGGDSGTANPPAPQLTTADLAAFAVGMHNLTGAVTYPTTFDIATNALNVTVTAIVDCSGPCPALTYDWNWGDGNNASCTAPGLPFACCTAPGSGTCDSSFLTPSASHTYPIGGTKSITLTVKSDGGTKRVGSATRSFRITAPSVPVSFAGPSAACTGPGAPLACCTGSGTGTCTYNDACTAAGVPWACCTGSGAGTCSANPTCTWNGDTWTMRVDASASGGTAPLTIAIRWGDTSSATVIPAPAGVPVSASHLYLSSSGPYTVTATAIDAKLQSVEAQCAVPATPTRYQITGTVRKVGPNTPVANALVRLRRGTTLVKSVYTAADGTFTLMGLRPAAYMLKVSKAGFTFPAAQAVAVGPDNALGDIFGTKP
jgi:hypothetical protein